MSLFRIFVGVPLCVAVSCGSGDNSRVLEQHQQGTPELKPVQATQLGADALRECVGVTVADKTLFDGKSKVVKVAMPSISWPTPPP